MIHWHPGWLGSRFNVIVINIFVKAYGENECGSVYWNPEAPANYVSQGYYFSFIFMVEIPPNLTFC